MQTLRLGRASHACQLPKMTTFYGMCKTDKYTSSCLKSVMRRARGAMRYESASVRRYMYRRRSEVLLCTLPDHTCVFLWDPAQRHAHEPTQTQACSGRRSPHLFSPSPLRRGRSATTKTTMASAHRWDRRRTAGKRPPNMLRHRTVPTTTLSRISTTTRTPTTTLNPQPAMLRTSWRNFTCLPSAASAPCRCCATGRNKPAYRDWCPNTSGRHDSSEDLNDVGAFEALQAFPARIRF